MRNFLILFLLFLVTACAACPAQYSYEGGEPVVYAPETEMDGVPDYVELEPLEPTRSTAPRTRTKIRSIAEGTLRRASPMDESMFSPGPAVIPREISTDDIISQLKRAALALTVPKTSNISNDLPVKLLVSLEQSQRELIEELQAAEGVHVISDNVAVSRTMSATITAPDFEINTVTPTRQAITTIGNTEWLWSLRPTSPGVKHITITVVAHVMVDGERVERHIKTFEEELEIEITTTQRIKSFIESYWQWLFTTLLIPIGLYIRNLLKARKAKKELP